MNVEKRLSDNHIKHIIRTYQKYDLIEDNVTLDTLKNYDISTLILNTILIFFGKNILVIPRKGLDEGLFTLKDIYKNIRTTHDYLIYCFIEFAKPYFNISVNSITSLMENNELNFISFEHSGIKYQSNVNADIYHNVMCLVNRAIQEQFDNAPKIYLIDLDYSESTSFVMLNNEQFNYLYENRLMSFVDYEFPEITEWRKSVNLDNLPF